MPMNILKKTPEELKKMNEAGLDMFYLGIESGSDIVLKKVTKGAVAKQSSNQSIKQRKGRLHHVMYGDFRIRWKKIFKGTHQRNCRSDQRMFTKLCGALTLYLENGIKQEFIDKYKGEFVKINDDED